MEVELPDKIIGLDQMRISRGLGKICTCKNRKFILDTDNRRVICASCGSGIDPYDALYDLSYQDEERNRQLERFLEQKQEIAKYKPGLSVIKTIEKQYRGNKLVPNCPRCSEPFYLEELISWTGKQYADARIKKIKG
ncbi:MAG: hypothetical protein ACRC7N_04040 [Clostridium sp.]